MKEASKDTLFVFLDESGNLDFSQSGTDFYVLSAVTATEPIQSSEKLQFLKYNLLELGDDIEHFHASEDLQAIRDKVFSEIAKLENIRINYIFANKHFAHPKYHKSAKFYGLLGKTLLKYMFANHLVQKCQKVIIVFDKALTKKDQSIFFKEVKPELKRTGIPYQLYFHRTLSDFNGQIADYTAWAKYVSLSKNEQRPLQALAGIPQTEFDIFSRGTKKYY